MTETDAATAHPRARHTRLGGVLVGALVVALLLALGGAALALHRADHERDLRQAGAAAERAARRIAVDLTTYDHRTVDADYARVARQGTAHFRKEFAAVSADARASVTALQVSAVGTVVASAPKVRDSRHVEVLLFVDQRVHSVNSDGTRTEEPRLSMQMVREHGRWLVDSVALENSVA